MDRDQIIAGVATERQQDMQRQIGERHQLIQAINFLNRAEPQILGGNSRVQFQIDSVANRAVVKVVQADTKDVIYQLPPDYVLELARKARQKRWMKPEA